MVALLNRDHCTSKFLGRFQQAESIAHLRVDFPPCKPASHRKWFWVSEQL